MAQKNIKRHNIALVPSSDYFFIEFFVPLLEKTPDLEVYTIIWDRDSLDGIDPNIKKYALDLPSVVQIIEVDKLNCGLIRSRKITKKLLEQLTDIELVLAMDICSNVMLLVAAALENRGIKIAFVQCSGLHQNMWLSRYDGFRTRTLDEQRVLGTALKITKYLNLSKYPRYFIFLLTRILDRFQKLLLTYIFAPLTIGSFLPRRPVSRVCYFSSSKNYAVMIYSKDAEIFSEIIEPKNIVIAAPPYFAQGSSVNEKGLLIAFPGPISGEHYEEKFNTFFSVLAKVIRVRKPKILFYRFHPRETAYSRKKLLFLLEKHIGDEICDDVSGQPLHHILGQCHTVVGGVSNLLAVARATSKTKLVVGVKDAGLEGILGSNIQYQDIGEIFWVSSAHELDVEELQRNSFVQKTTNVVCYYDALLHLLNDSSHEDFKHLERQFKTKMRKNFL